MTSDFIFAVMWAPVSPHAVTAAGALVCARTKCSLRLQEFLVQEVGTLNNELSEICQMT